MGDKVKKMTDELNTKIKKWETMIDFYFQTLDNCIMALTSIEDIKNKSEYKCDLKDISKYILNITIQNCPNLKIINNIIYFEKICNLKIVNCPKLEFIQNYNNFSEIYVDNRLVKVVNE